MKGFMTDLDGTGEEGWRIERDYEISGFEDDKKCKHCYGEYNKVFRYSNGDTGIVKAWFVPSLVKIRVEGYDMRYVGICFDCISDIAGRG